MKYQQGSTLIMVLIVLLLITLIGTMAMRESLLNLRLSTGAQAGNLLLSNNDATLFDLENPYRVRVRLASNNVFGHFDNDLNIDDEVVFCFDSGAATVFQLGRASVINNPSKLGNLGYCQSEQFANARGNMISQVYVRKVPADENEPLSGHVQNNEVASGRSAGSKLRIGATSVSVLPSLTTTEFKDIQECFKKSAIKETTSTKDDNVEMCLQAKNVAYNLQYAEFNVEASPQNKAL